MKGNQTNFENESTDDDDNDKNYFNAHLLPKAPKVLMTPGPVYISEDVRHALSQEITNPDLDLQFFEYYKKVCESLQKFMKTKNEVLILAGEGILGLEAACASLIEKGDKVLSLDNGIFGKGFGDFAKIYGADLTYFKNDYRRKYDLKKLEEFLEEKKKNGIKFKICTLVHTETPSGITNDISKICPLLKKYGMITIVDSVAGMGGEHLETDEWKIDVALGGSQKCLSAPPGLTFLSISKEAWEIIDNRKSPIGSFYCSLKTWRTWYKDKWFPYTQSISDIYALGVAVEKALKDKNMVKRHYQISNAVRNTIMKAGLEQYPLDGFSNPVTTIALPNGVSFDQIYNEMLKHSVMIGGAFGHLANKYFRIGHMGENCKEEKVYLTFKALDSVLRKLNVEIKVKLHHEFVNQISEFEKKSF